MLRKVLSTLSALLLVAGAVQGGRGGWIYAKAKLAQVLLHHSWERTLAGEGRVRPWPWADAWPVARLILPATGGDHIVLTGASGRNLAFAPGHLHGTAPPGGDGACVVAGHRDTHFAALEELAPGDVVGLEGADGALHSYRVTAAEVVDEHDTWAIMDGDRPTLVLITCWPFDSPVVGGPLRYVVWAEDVTRENVQTSNVNRPNVSTSYACGGSLSSRSCSFIGSSCKYPLR